MEPLTRSGLAESEWQTYAITWSGRLSKPRLGTPANRGAEASIYFGGPFLPHVLMRTDIYFRTAHIYPPYILFAWNLFHILSTYLPDSYLLFTWNYSVELLSGYTPLYSYSLARTIERQLVLLGSYASTT